VERLPFGQTEINDKARVLRDASAWGSDQGIDRRADMQKPPRGFRNGRQMGKPGLAPDRLGTRGEARYRTVSESRVVAMFVLGGWAFEVEAGRYAEALASVQDSLEVWISLGLEYRRSESGERLFDPVEVLNFVTWSGVNGLDRFWSDRLVGTARLFVHYGSPVEALPPTRVSARLRRTVNVRQAEGGAKMRLRVPLPLRGAYVHDLDVIPLVAPELGGDVVLRNGILEWQLATPATPLVEFGADVSFTATPRVADTLAGRLDATEAEIYLRGGEGLIRVSPRIGELANRLAASNGDALRTVERFWDYLIDEFLLGLVHYDQVSVDAPCDWVLDSGWYDCQLGAALLASLCRARGIPARIVGGHFLFPLAPTKHFWAEVWIDGRGWLPFDLHSWQLSAGGRDRKWRHHFAAKIDYRMPTQCLPLEFTGPMSVRLPPAWHMLQFWKDGELEIPMLKLDGALLFSDRVSVRLDGANPKTPGRSPLS
jgi:transglutaminase-like putative cysteine protease